MGALAKKLLIGTMVVLLTLLVVAGVFVAFELVPFRYVQAHQLWLSQRPRHYQLDVSWASGWEVGSARIEMRDGQLVKAIDTTTGQPLPAYRLTTASYFGSIDKLFMLIDKQVQANRTWRNLLVNYVPSLGRWLGTCKAPLGKVTYDSHYGYPTDIWYITGWCGNTFYTYSNVKVTQFNPLP